MRIDHGRRLDVLGRATAAVVVGVLALCLASCGQVVAISGAPSADADDGGSRPSARTHRTIAVDAGDGPATATVVYDGVREHLRGGHCDDGRHYGVEFGILDAERFADGAAEGYADYFGLLVAAPRQGGEQALVTMFRGGRQVPGTTDLVIGTATVDADLGGGTFEVGPVSGTWDCGT